jgi:hypothetical protein
MVLCKSVIIFGVSGVVSFVIVVIINVQDWVFFVLAFLIMANNLRLTFRAFSIQHLSAVRASSLKRFIPRAEFALGIFFAGIIINLAFTLFHHEFSVAERAFYADFFAERLGVFASRVINAGVEIAVSAVAQHHFFAADIAD